MPLSVGTRLGPYEIVAAIGAGGMGEVYRAHDTRLDRDVAIKLLPEAFADDAERVARFQREAKVLASLNHPHIAAIYGLEDADGVKALVMELVEGEDLAQRLARGATPLDEALAIAKQIAEAVEAAHEQGIIHRDLKPANIKVREDGTVKVLDFGLAKALETAQRPSDASQSPTFTSPALTRLDVILGTPAYMSPEQARGQRSISAPTSGPSAVWCTKCSQVAEHLHVRRSRTQSSRSWSASQSGPHCRPEPFLPSTACCVAASRRIREAACATSAMRASS